MSPRDREAFLVQSALARIEKARARGRADVRLNKHELAALDRHRKREEKEKKKRAAERKKRKDQRIAVPLTQLEPASRKKSRPPVARQPMPRYPSSGSNLGEEQEQRQGYPPMGYFPPSSTPRSRARSGTTSQRPPSRPPSRPTSRAAEDRGGTPYDYTTPSRHVSDSMSGTAPTEESWAADTPSSSSRAAPDPFRFQTSGPRSTMGSPASAASRRHTMAPSEAAYMGRRRAAGPVTRSRASNREPDATSDEEEEGSDDDDEGSSEEREDSSDNRMRTREASRGRKPASVVADQEAESQPAASKKSTKASPPPKRKQPVRTGRRRK